MTSADEGTTIDKSFPVRDQNRAPTHPGELIREVIFPALAQSKTEVAKLLGISRQTLYDIIEERSPVTPDMAVRFGKLFGNGAEVWAGMQAAHDLWHSKRLVDVSAIPTIKAV